MLRIHSSQYGHSPKVILTGLCNVIGVFPRIDLLSVTFLPNQEFSRLAIPPEQFAPDVF
jgi:hypothetical protein